MLKSAHTALVAAVLTTSGCGPPADNATAAATTRFGATAGAQSPSTTAPSTATVDAGEWQVAGTSVQGRPIRVRHVGGGPREVLFVGGIHGDETEGAYTTAQLPAAFISAGLAPTVTLTILEDANPDGTAARTRENANGVDVNRNFPASNFDTTNPACGGSPLSQPESRAVYETIKQIRPELVLVAHSWVNDQFINFDGPALQIANRFSATSGLPVHESKSFAPTPGSLGSFVGRDSGTPILTIEVRKGTPSDDVWKAIGPALMQAIAG